MKKKRVLAVLVALLLVVGAGVYTYARYTFSRTGSDDVDVATWAVALKQGGSAVSDNFTLTLTLEPNNNVVNGKIAPDRSATAILTLDLTGTEVAVDFDAVIDQTALSSFGDSGDKLSLAVKVDGTNYTSGTTHTISLVNNSAFTAENGKKTVTLTLTWANDDLNNADDTATGVAAPTLTVPVTLTAKQHIA